MFSGKKFTTMLGAGALALATAGAAQAADLIHNAGNTLNLTGVQSFDNVFVGNLSNSASNIVDAAATTSFTSNGTQFFVGAGPSGFSLMTGTLKLGANNSITANQITIGGLEPDSNGSAGHAGLVTTADNSITTINAGNMALGTGKGNGTQISGGTGGRFTLGSGATLNLNGLTGSNSRAALVLGRFVADTAVRGQGTMNLSAGTANLVLSELSLGKVTDRNGLGASNQTVGTMTLGASASNHLDVSGTGSVVKIGFNSHPGPGDLTNTHGTLTIDNLDSTSSITSTDNSTAILIGHRSAPSGTIQGTLNFNGGTLTITTTGAAIAGGGGTSTLNLSGGATLIAGANSPDWIHSLSNATIGTGGAAINTNGFDIGVSQAFSGAGSLTKAGAGSMTLTGTNTYGGQTHVNAGSLLVNGSLSSGGGQVNVNPNGTLGGIGAINRAVVLDDGILSPGASAGTITIGGNLSGTGSYLWELGALDDDSTGTAGTDWDLVSMTSGNADASGLALQLDFSLLGPGEDPDGGNPFWATDRTWLVLELLGSATNSGPTNFNSIVNGNFSSGTFSTFLDNDNQIHLAFTANVIPESSTLALLGVGLLGLAVVAWRRRK